MKLQLHQEAPASWLREARVSLGLTQLELAHALSVTPSTVSRWETGAEPIGNAQMLRLAVEHLACTRPRVLREVTVEQFSTATACWPEEGTVKP